MAATRRNVNNRTVTFTPTSGTPTTITGVTNVAVATGGNVLKFSGDADRFPTTVMNDFSDPNITVTAADIAALTANSIGTFGTLSFVNKDARQQTATSGSGDITCSITGMIGDTPFSSPYRQFSTGTLMVTGQSSDGLTSPISLSIAA